MTFDSRQEYINAQSSEKIILAHIDARARILPWTLYSGTTYYKQVDNFVVKVHNGLTEYTQGANQLSLSSGQFYFSPTDNRLYVNTGGNPVNEEIIATFRLFFSNASLALPYNLTPGATKVEYVGRIQRAPGFKHKIGVEQDLVSIIGNGSLKLLNTDGGLDEIYERYIFDNQTISMYSWHRDLPISDSKIFYRGRITDKRFDTQFVWFEVKDELVDLKAAYPLSVYGDSENVTDSVKAHYKRQVYGRVDGLKIQSTDQIGSGYSIPGLFTSATPKKQVVAVTGAVPAGNTYTSSGPGDYFFIYSANNSNKYVYWFNVNNNNTEPSLGDEYSYVEVAILSTDSTVQVRDKLAAELDGNFNMIGPYVITAENTDFGRANFPQDVNSGVVFTVLTVGVGTKTLIGSGTSFYSDVSPDDKLTIDSQEFTIENIISDTELDVTAAPKFSFINLPATLKPDRPTTTKNREFFVADHECAEITTTLTDIKQFNRVEVASNANFFVGDFIEFNTLERAEIKNLVGDNIIVLQQNVVTLPTIGTQVIRRPVQEVFIGQNRVLDDDFTTTNSGDCRITISADAEFNLAPVRQFNFNLHFINGSRDVNAASVDDLSDYIKPRDWVKPQNLSYSTFYEVLSVGTGSLQLRTVFGEADHNGPAEGKSPDYIDDDTIVSTNILGKTETGLKDGQWIYSAAQTIKDMLILAGLTEINTASFNDGIERNRQIIGVTIPPSPGSSQTTFKTLIDNICRSTNSVITLDNDLKIQYRILDAAVPTNPVEITDYDVISWEVETVSGKNIRNSVIYYKEKDVVRATQESGSDVTTYSSAFVEKYVGTNNTEERTIKLYNEEDAKVFANRLVYLQSIGRTDMTITTDLRFEDVEIGEVVVVNFNRMYKRLGSNNSKRKMMFVYGKSLNGSRTILELTDYGNLYNRSSKITANDHPDFVSSTDEERLNGGYITENNGIINNDEDTAGIHLIS